MIDQSAGDGYALLFAAGELRWEMGEALAESYALERFFGLFFVSDGMEVLREHYVFNCVEIRNEVELLEDEADFFGAVTDQGIFAEFREIDAVHYDAAGGECVETS